MDRDFLLMSIEMNRVSDLLSINPLLFDFYLDEGLSREEKSKVLDQIRDDQASLFQVAQLFVQQENYSSLISFGLLIDTLEKYFPPK